MLVCVYDSFMTFCGYMWSNAPPINVMKLIGLHMIPFHNQNTLTLTLIWFYRRSQTMHIISVYVFLCLHVCMLPYYMDYIVLNNIYAQI